MEMDNNKKLITIMSDFGWSSQGVGIMKALASYWCNDAIVVDITHEISSYSPIDGASELETVYCLPPGGIHVCVVDPGVGTSRKVLLIETERGDTLIGPDNGVLLPAARRLGGIRKIIHVINSPYSPGQVSSTFHGRDVMIPAAAAVANGIEIAKLGNEILNISELCPAAYEQAQWNDNHFEATVIHINKFGTVYLNISASDFVHRKFLPGVITQLKFDDHIIEVPVCLAFGDVPKNAPLIYKDHYERVQIALNLSSFTSEYNVALGDRIKIYHNDI